MMIKISDLLDGLALPAPDLGEAPCDKEAVKMKTFEKIDKTEGAGRRTRRRVSRAALVAAVLAVVLALGAIPAVAAVAVPPDPQGRFSWWTGFKTLTGLDQQERLDMIRDLCDLGPDATMVEDHNGNVTLYNADGSVRCVLTPEEYKLWTEEIQRRSDEAALSATDKVDIASLPNIPRAVNELPVSQGAFEDFAFENGGMVVLYPEIGEGWELQKGDLVTVTLRLEKVSEDDYCNLVLYTFRDGAYESRIDMFGESSYVFEYQVPENGTWNFALYHASCATGAFTDGTFIVQRDSDEPVAVE